MIFINFKTYQSGTGERAVEMVRLMERVSKEVGVEMGAVVQAVDVYRVSDGAGMGIWCQHADGIEYGAHSGWLLPEAIKDSGAGGVMLNHSERKFTNIKYQISNIKNKDDDLYCAVERCRAVGLQVMVCADDLEEVKRMVGLAPDWIAYEPPELIGNSEISVSTAKPEVVRQAVEACGQFPLLIGAGVHNEQDIRKGLELGAAGFLIASAVMLAGNPGEKLRELTGGYR